MEKNNIYPATPLASPGEVSIDLFRKGSVTIERIISHVHSSPAGFWYDQAEDERVIVLPRLCRIGIWRRRDGRDERRRPPTDPERGAPSSGAHR